ncbi:uncharacterized protein Z518_03316 [Rhinocladiella mackenziei CBS 650.93]|uniref:DRBM domain-containing protein n=1 Tax=Rhinocladiella mackenziei CBS 650.93 TaxID=1442369 RepID=A0A0D2IRP2_9EURO|nr:uncharacterized protein Z518_03316 [Rhinocladiella mackenziei CBS 650.93]KIX08659.1 hypothetical protein Z518_03316 [Rhinocladiella mackenziei CBS 650.93]
MFKLLLAKLCPSYRSRKKAKVIKELSSPLSAPVDDHEGHMDLPVLEMPGDHVVGHTSLFVSVDVARRDEWLGEKYLDYMLAQTVLKNTPGRDGVTSLNGDLIQRLARFRYDNCCEELNLKRVRRYQPTDAGQFALPVNYREILLGWIGSILSRGTLEERNVLPHVVAQCSQQHSPEIFQSTGSVNTNSESDTAGQQDPTYEDLSSEESETDIWRYTKTLQETTAGKDSVPLYKETLVRAYPPRFRYEVTYRGKKATGEAGNKKRAKHLASKKLCELLHIKLPD